MSHILNVTSMLQLYRILISKADRNSRSAFHQINKLLNESNTNKEAICIEY